VRSAVVRRSRTIATYRRDFERHIRPSLGRHRLDALRPEHLSRFYADRLHQGLSAYAVRYLHAQIRRALAVAVTWGLLARNVATFVQPPALPHHEVDPLTVEEARQLLLAARSDRMEARWVIGLSLGLRQSEVLGLWWEDIDFKAGTLRIRRQLIRSRTAGQALAFGPLKSARSMRVLALPPALAAALERHRDRQRREQHEAGSAWADPRLVFASTTGGPVDHRNDTRAFKALVRAAGVRCSEITSDDGTVRLVPQVRLHDLRHTAATLLLAPGGARPGADGGAGPLADRHHHEHLQPCHADAAHSGRERHGGRAVGRALALATRLATCDLETTKGVHRFRKTPCS
jgi:integrase